MNTNKKEIKFRKHSAMIQMSNKVTKQQRKAFNALIYIARDILKEDSSVQVFEIDLKIIRDLCGVLNTSKKYFKQSIKDLTAITVEYNILSKDNGVIWGAFVLLAGAQIKDGILRYNFPFQVLDAIKNLSMYTTLDLSIIKGLDSKYTVALYELAKDYCDVEIPKMTIDKFKELMGVEESQYKNLYNLKEKVIDVSVDEFNQKIDMFINYELVKRGRKVTDIKFNVKEKTKKNLLEHKPEPESEKEDKDFIKIFALLPDELKAQGSVRKLITKHLNEKGFDYVKSNIVYSANNAKENLKAYLKKALDSDYGGELRAKEKERLEHKELEKKKTEEKERKEIEKEERYEKKYKQVMELYMSLSPEDQVKVDCEVEENLSSIEKDMLDNYKKSEDKKMSQLLSMSLMNGKMKVLLGKWRSKQKKPA